MLAAAAALRQFKALVLVQADQVVVVRAETQAMELLGP
jgi:hypothetical protein